MINLRVAHAGSGGKKLYMLQLVAIPLLKVAVASHGGRGDSSPLLHDVPVESIIAAPNGVVP